MTLRLTTLAVAAAVAVSGCGRSRPLPAQAGLSPAPVPPGDSFGAVVVADIENARFAIAHRDLVAADNDLLDATGFAKRLDKQRPGLFLIHPAPNDAPGRLTQFELQTGLVQARTSLRMGDLGSSDRELAALLQRVPAALTPPEMPLARARATLRLAKAAAQTGRIKEVRTRLEGARDAVAQYAGRGADKPKRKLESAIGSYLSPGGLERLSPTRAALLAGKVDALIKQAQGGRPT